MTTEIEGIKALLDIHMTNIRGELLKLSTSYEGIRSQVDHIGRTTDVAIAEIKKDVTSLQDKTKLINDEVNAVKHRIDINDDVQIERWTEQGTRNKIADTKDNRIIGLLLSAIGVVIMLVITQFWRVIFP